ncbi:MAG: M12 family metallopeptidase, partial [Betaproteobacteria bacterium]
IDSFNATFAGLIRWVPRTTQADYVAFNMVTANLNACASNFGRVGGRQQITGDPTCNASLLLHEMGHAMGLLHVQADPAAANFMTFFLDRMSPRYAFNSMPQTMSRAYSGYDYRSIMHYARNSFGMTPDGLTSNTKPPGMDIGIREGYSAGDRDTLLRIYGAPPTATTITSNPPGLRVLVDGNFVVTPLTVNWAIGSVHQLDIPVGLQSASGASFSFGRWSHDAEPVPQGAQSWSVIAGKDYPGQPAGAPETTVLTANFVRLLNISYAATGANSLGSYSITPETTPWPGSTSLFRPSTKFTLSAQGNAGAQPTFGWASAFSIAGGFGGGAGSAASATLRVSESVAAQLLSVSFSSPPGLLLTASGPGVDRSLAASVTGPNSVASVLMPYSRSGAGTYTITIADTQTRGTDERFVLDGIDGLDSPFANTVTVSNTSAFTPVNVRLHKEVQTVVQRNPTCGGTLALSDAGPWHAYGTVLNSTATPNSAVVFAGWTGSVSGMNPAISTAIGDTVPEIIANFNTIAEPLDISALAPGGVTGSGPWTIEIRGSGFTRATRVAVSGRALVPEYVDAHLLRLTLTGANLSPTGKTAIYLYNGLGGSCFAFSHTAALDALPSSATLTDYTDMWWAGAAENGWGMSITQHGAFQFAVLYVYDAGGKPIWYVMPGGAWNPNRTRFTGTLYLPTSSPFNAYDTSQFKANAPVGTATLAYSGTGTATLTYVIDGIAGSKALSRQIFGSGQAPMQVNDLWWNPAESGWGLNIAQQGATLFPVWYTYDAAGKDTWFVVPGGTWNGNSFTGDMYGTTGSPWLGAVYNPSALVVTKVGAMTLSFSDVNNGVMTYTVNGITQSKGIVRQPF